MELRPINSQEAERRAEELSDPPGLPLLKESHGPGRFPRANTFSATSPLNLQNRNSTKRLDSLGMGSLILWERKSETAGRSSRCGLAKAVVKYVLNISPYLISCRSGSVDKRLSMSVRLHHRDGSSSREQKNVAIPLMN